jgi:hypothetical protein
MASGGALHSARAVRGTQAVYLTIVAIECDGLIERNPRNPSATAHILLVCCQD